MGHDEHILLANFSYFYKADVIPPMLILVKYASYTPSYNYSIDNARTVASNSPHHLTIPHHCYTGTYRWRVLCTPTDICVLGDNRNAMRRAASSQRNSHSAVI